MRCQLSARFGSITRASGRVSHPARVLLLVCAFLHDRSLLVHERTAIQSLNSRVVHWMCSCTNPRGSVRFSFCKRTWRADYQDRSGLLTHVPHTSTHACVHEERACSACSRLALALIKLVGLLIMHRQCCASHASHSTMGTSHASHSTMGTRLPVVDSHLARQQLAETQPS